MSPNKIVRKRSRNALRKSDKYDGLDIYLSQIAGPFLTREEEFALAVKKMVGDEGAERELVNHNLLFVVSVAKRYAGRGIDLFDLISFGNIGLVDGVREYNPYHEKRANVRTYVCYHIKKQICAALKKERQRYFTKYHPKDDPVIFVPLDSTIEKNGTPLEATIEDIHAEMSYDKSIGESDSNYLHDLLKNLDEREKAVIRLRFLGHPEDTKTLEEIGRKYHVTRERIRQVQEVALHKLRKLHLEKKAQLDKTKTL